MDGEGVDGGAGGGAEDSISGDGHREHRLMDLGVVGPLSGFGGADDGVDGLVGGEAAEHTDAVHGWVHWAVVVRVVPCEDRMEAVWMTLAGSVEGG